MKPRTVYREGREDEYLAALELVLGADVGGALISDAGVGVDSGSDTAASAGTTAGLGAAADSGPDAGPDAGPAADSDVGSDAGPARPAHPKERND